MALSLAKLLTLNPEGLGPYDLLGKASTFIAEQQTLLYKNKPCVTRSKGMSKGKDENLITNLQNIIKALLMKTYGDKTNTELIMANLLKDAADKLYLPKDWSKKIELADKEDLSPKAALLGKAKNALKSLKFTIKNEFNGGTKMKKYKKKAVVTRRKR